MKKICDSEKIDQTAAKWAARLDRGPLTQGERETLSSWMNADSRHQGALVRAQALLIPDDQAMAGLDQLTRPGSHSPGALKTVIGTMLAAAAAVLVLLVPDFRAPDAADYQTAHGEISRLPLEDGSILTLNAASNISTHFEKDVRRVELASGEGFFEVAKDPSRPFIVSVEDYSVKAVGTAFAVRKYPDEIVNILVFEGKVDVQGKENSPVRLVAGDALRVDTRTNSQSRSKLDEEQVLQELAWRQGNIALTGQTLEYAARQFNRYNSTQISISSEIRDLEIVGWFSASDPAGFSTNVAKAFELEVSIQENRILIAPRS